jgi:hypothetical protein
LFAQSRQQLAALTEQAKQQQIDRVYFDESGFTLEPCIPYAWQPVGETIEVPCAKSKRLNVLGFMNKNGSFQSWVFEQSLTSAVVVACIDAFTESLKRPGVLVIDNAPIHTSHEFRDNIDRWAATGVDDRTDRALFPRTEPDRNTLAKNKIPVDAVFRLRVFPVP